MTDVGNGNVVVTPQPPLRIKLVSDLHFEWQRDRGEAFCKLFRQIHDSFDVLVVAGDLASSDCLEDALMGICNAVFPKEVIYVAGNHEYWGSDYREVHDLLDQIDVRYENLHVLDESAATIQGQRFIGATLWFPDHPEARKLEKKWVDFRHISGLADWVYDENASTQCYFRDNIQSGDVVVTHHLPSYLAVTPRWAGNACNRFFVTPMDEVIVEARPTLWLYGHTHDSNDFQLNGTRLICNPYGYSGYEVNPTFDSKLVINIDRKGG